MAENYVTALRDKRELERKLRNFSRDGRRNVSKIKQEKFALIHGLHDVRSKSKNLSDTIEFIRKSLRDQRSNTEEELSRLAARRRALTQKEVERERQLLVKLELADLKARHIGGLAADDDSADDDRVLEAIEEAVSGQGAQGSSNAVKAKTQHVSSGKSNSDDEEDADERERLSNVPDNLPDLIKFYVMYPPEHKVTLKKPKKTDFSRARLERLKEDQVNALTIGTKTRLRRVTFHCKAIEGMYLDQEPIEAWSRKLARAPGAAAP